MNTANVESCFYAQTCTFTERTLRPLAWYKHADKRARVHRVVPESRTDVRLMTGIYMFI